MASCAVLLESPVDRLRALGRAIGLRARAADWLGAELIAAELAEAWGDFRPWVLRGRAGRAAATLLDGTTAWISVAIGRRDALATLKASGEFSREIGSLGGSLAA
jgi:hypothetical protein